jgi:hypothetical protein
MKIDRYRLGVPEYERSAHDHQKKRDENRPNEVYMRYRVEGKASEPRRCRIAQAISHPTMGYFMEHDGKKHR